MAEIRKKFSLVKDKVLPVITFLRRNELLTAEALINIGLLIYGSIAINFLSMKGISDDIQIIITFPLLFFVPGYAITQLSFYENRNKLEILAMSFAISLAMIPLFIYFDVARIRIIRGVKWREELAIIALVLLTLLVLVRHVGKVILEVIAKMRSTKTPKSAT
jgi:peptidoglycan/LPS O-acetylase OafA/YrhL